MVVILPTWRYMDRSGIDVGHVELIVYAQPLQGKRWGFYTCTINVCLQWKIKWRRFSSWLLHLVRNLCSQCCCFFYKVKSSGREPSPSCLQEQLRNIYNVHAKKQSFALLYMYMWLIQFHYHFLFVISLLVPCVCIVLLFLVIASHLDTGTLLTSVRRRARSAYTRSGPTSLSLLPTRPPSETLQPSLQSFVRKWPHWRSCSRRNRTASSSPHLTTAV